MTRRACTRGGADAAAHRPAPDLADAVDRDLDGRRRPARVAVSRSARGQKGFQATDLQVLSTIFLRMIKSLIVPLLFATLVVGHRRPRRRHEAGRASSRSGRSSTSRSSRRWRSSSGSLAVNIVKPGVGREPRRRDRRGRRRVREDEDDVRGRASSTPCRRASSRPRRRTRCSRSSSSRSSSPSRCRRCRGRRRRSCSSFCESLSEVMFKFVGHRDEVRARSASARPSRSRWARAGSACCGTSACSCSRSTAR